jgi:TRAP-type uncharacterized transport system, fused permease components
MPSDSPNTTSSSVAPLLAAIVAVVAIGLSLFQLYTAGIQTINLFYQRGGHLAFILVLAFLLFPVSKRAWIRWPVDLVFVAGAIASTGYLLWNLTAIVNRSGFYTQQDVVMGAIGVVVVLEAARRVIGPTISLIGVGFIL